MHLAALALEQGRPVSLMAADGSDSCGCDEAIVALAPDGRIIGWNGPAADLFSLDGQAAGGSIEHLHADPGIRSAITCAFTSAISTGAAPALDLRLGSEDVAVSIQPFFGPGRRIAGAALVGRRIPCPASVQERDRFAREIEHRTSGAFALVRSLARQMFDYTEAGSASSHFLGRLDALARNHEMRRPPQWRHMRLHDVAAEQVSVHTDGTEERCSLQGPNVELGSKAAVSLGMAFHELGANSAKFGAFSVPDGRVVISWVTEGDPSNGQLRLRWREFGGPPVAPPVRRGFGSRIIEEGVARELDARAELLFHRTGVWYVLDAPLSAIVPP